MNRFYKSGFTLLEVIIVVAIVAVLGGVAAYEYHTNNIQTVATTSSPAAAASATATPAPSAIATSTPVTTATPDPTAGWKTYTDTSTGASFKYPTTWTASSTSTAISFVSPERAASTKSGTLDYRSDGMAVYFYASAADLTNSGGKAVGSATLADWLSSQKGSPAVQSYAQTSMTLTYYPSNPVYSVENASPGTTLYTEVNHKVFDFSGDAGGLTNTDNSILESIKVTP